MAFGFIKKIFSFGSRQVEETPPEGEAAPALPPPAPEPVAAPALPPEPVAEIGRAHV